VELDNASTLSTEYEAVFTLIAVQVQVSVCGL